MLLKFILSSLILYIVFIASLFFTQRKLLYFPTKSLPTEQFLQTEKLQYWNVRDCSYRALISTETKNTQGTIIVFHGNAGTADNRSYYSRALTARGYRVLLAEYPGYGGRKGKPSEVTFITDARETVNSIYQEYGSPVYLLGESLGSGVVAATVADSRLPVAGIILITPWDSLANLAQNIYWYFPVRWLLLDKFDSVNNLKSFHGRVAVLIAEKDEVIPPQFGLNLYQSIKSEKKLWKFKNAGHNNFPINPEAAWWEEVINFISE